jgi:TRAP-type C4-dicarboxylate transport system permease small subunit
MGAAIDRALHRLGDAAALCFAVALVISALEVAMRYAFNAPTSWVHVSSTALCVAAFAVCGAYSMARGEHMRMTAFFDRAPRGWQRVGRWLALVCGAVYLCGLAWGLGREAIDSLWRFDSSRWIPEQTPGPPNWPLPALAKGALLVGALLFLLAVARDAWKLAHEDRA